MENFKKHLKDRGCEDLFSQFSSVGVTSKGDASDMSLEDLQAMGLPVDRAQNAFRKLSNRGTPVGQRLESAGLSMYCKAFFDHEYYEVEEVNIDFRHLEIMDAKREHVLPLLDLFMGTEKKYSVFVSCNYDEVGKATTKLFKLLYPRLESDDFDRIYYNPGLPIDQKDLQRHIQNSKSMLIVLSKGYLYSKRWMFEAIQAHENDDIHCVACIVDNGLDREVFAAPEEILRRIASDKSADYDVNATSVERLLHFLCNTRIFSFHSKGSSGEQIRQARFIEEALAGKINLIMEPLKKDNGLSKDLTKFLWSKNWEELIPLLSAGGITDLRSAAGKDVENYFKIGVPLKYAFLLVEELKSLKDVRDGTLTPSPALPELRALDEMVDKPKASEDPAKTKELLHSDMNLTLPQSYQVEFTESLKERVQVLLVTTKQVEWEAVFRKLTPLVLENGENKVLKVHPNKSTYMIGQFGAYCAALVQTDEGPLNAQFVVNEAVQYLKPKAMFLIGVGFGLKPHQQAVGDVMVCDRLANYDLQRVENNQIINLGEVTHAGAYLSSLFKNLDTCDWRFGSSNIHRGLMLSGSKLIENDDAAQALLKDSPDAVGGDMEGEGLYSACFDNKQDWIVVKGISNFAGLTEGTIEHDDPFAAAAATSLVLHILSGDNLKGLGCVAETKGTLLPSPYKTWTPKGLPVFVSYDPGFYDRDKGGGMVDSLLKRLRMWNVNVYASDSSHLSTSFSTAQVERAVFLALVDHEYYLQSKVCMREMKRALNARYSSNVEVLPVLLSPCSKYPSHASDVSKVFGGLWQSEWQLEWKSYNAYLDVVNTFVSLAKEKTRCVFEDPSFGVDTLAQEAATLFGPENVNASSSQLQQASPSLWRTFHPIRECNPPKISDTTVEIHQSSFQKILHVLTSKDKTSVSIAGLKAAGGVGKTVLARRIANCPTVKERFASEGVLWAEFGELDSTADSALERIYRDLGGIGELHFDVDSTGQLMKARESFERLLTSRRPTALLVLDDVWKKKYLQVFKQVINDTNVKVLITTRFKGIVEEMFGQENENSVIYLNPFLSQDDAFMMMNKYAGLGSIKKTDEPTMLKLAGNFGYHAMSLAIVSVRSKHVRSWPTWESLLSSVEESKLELDGAVEAKEWVFAAVKHKLAFALKEHPDLIEYYLQLGVLVEGARVSLSDLCVVWSCKMAKADEIANTLFVCSVLERDESPKHDEDAVYYMHDLVRDCARQDKHATEEREKEFVQKLIFIFHNERDRVTEYTIKYLPQHLSADTADNALISEVNNINSMVRGGNFDEKWSNTSCIVLAAFTYSGDALENAGLNLCQRKGFLQRALNSRDDIWLDNCKWIRNVDALKMFADALKTTCRLRSLELYSNKIGDYGAITMVNSLKENSHCALEDLRLSYENIKDDGVKCLAKWVEVNETLAYLYIGGTAIGVVGAKAIGKALKENKILKELVLCNNNIGDIAATELAKGLNKNSTLQTLNLYNNKIGDDGAIAFANALKVNSTLNKLYLEGNYIDEGGRAALRPYRKRVRF